MQKMRVHDTKKRNQAKKSDYPITKKAMKKK